MIRAVLWDHDGVLVDTEELYLRATSEVLAAAGVTLSRAEHRRISLVEGRSPLALAYPEGTGGFERLRTRRDERYAALLAERDHTVPGIVPLLEALAPTLRMAIVTSCKRVHFQVIHQRTQLLRFFEFVLTREDYGRSKPAPEPYLLAVARLGLKPEECLVIEDSERGLRAALSAGLRCWVLPSSLTRESRFEGAERCFGSLNELSDALSCEAEGVNPPMAREPPGAAAAKARAAKRLGPWDGGQQ